MRKLDIQPGMRFNRLTIIKEVEPTIGPKSKKPYRKFLFGCDCGNEKEILLRSVTQNMTKSCGCLLSESTSERSKNSKHQIKHSHNFTNKRTSTYISWVSMKQRCLNPNSPDYKNYGGRGIKICEEWLNFIGFLNSMGERPIGTSIDRINVDGDYCPENCRWATITEQNNNRRNSAKHSSNQKTDIMLEVSN